MNECNWRLVTHALLSAMVVSQAQNEAFMPSCTHRSALLTTLFMSTARRGFYRAMLCIRGISHGPVSIRLSVSVISRCSVETDEGIELVFGM